MDLRKHFTLFLIFVFNLVCAILFASMIFLTKHENGDAFTSDFDFSLEIYGEELGLEDQDGKFIKKIQKKDLPSAINSLKEFSEKIECEQVSELEFLCKFFGHDFTVIGRLNDVDASALRDRILQVLGPARELYGVYIYDLKRDLEIGINEKRIFPPMSISKLPVGVMILREVARGATTLDSTFVLNAVDIADPTNVLGPSYIGQSFKISDYLRFLLIDSDNTSIRKLENIMGGNLLVNERVKQELKVGTFFRQPHQATAADIGRVWRGIYKSEYLPTELNRHLIDLLLRTHPLLQDGIPVGVPPGRFIAHKTGQGSSNPGFIWADSGIIYGEETDYVLVILNTGIAINSARSNIQQISRIVYQGLNSI